MNGRRLQSKTATAVLGGATDAGSGGARTPIRDRHRVGVAGLARARGGIYSVATVIVLLVMWAVVARIIDDPVSLPEPSSIWAKGIELYITDRPTMWPDVAASLTRVFFGWGLGLIVGVLLGAAMALSSVLRIPLDLILQSGRAVPPLAFVPLLIVWLGIGELSKVFLIFIATVPIVAIATLSGISGVDVSLRRAALTLGSSPMHITRCVVIPAALPEIITSMRITLGVAWSCLVAAELIASTEGIGYRILQAGRYLDTATIFVGIITIAIAALIGDQILQGVQRFAVPWKGRG